jgi:hypothetical protein
MTISSRIRFLIAISLGLFVATGCVASPQVTITPDIEACAAIFDTSEEELGLTPEADFAVGQRNYANWLGGMLGDADDPTLRSAGLAAAGAARAAAAKYEEVGYVGPDDGEVLITALLKVETRCKQLMGLVD